MSSKGEICLSKINNKRRTNNQIESADGLSNFSTNKLRNDKFLNLDSELFIFSKK